MDVVDLYLRKSNYDGGNSAGRQETDLTTEAADEGLTIGRTFVDPDLSASRFRKKERPDYDALVAHIDSGQCRVVGIVEASRGSRGLTEWSGFLDLCRRKAVRIWVQTHQRIYDLSRRRDWRALADEGVDAADESERISERTLSGKRKSAVEGKPAGRVPYGYGRRYDPAPDSKWRKPIPIQIVNEREKPVVVEMYERVAAGGPDNTLAGIARDLNTRDVPKRSGKPWTARAIRQMLLRPGYAGRRVHHGAIVGDAAWPALVDERLWRKACATLTRPGRRVSRGTALAHWLSGAALCGACRADYLRPGSGGRYTCRACHKLTVAGAPFEALIEAAVLGRLADPGFADAFRAAQPDTSGDLAKLETERDDLRTTLDGHYAEARARRLSPGGLAVVEAGLLEDIAKVERRLKMLSLPEELAEVGEPADIVREWGTLEPRKRRIVVRAVMALVVMPAVVKGGRGLDPRRLDASRWTGDTLTWGERGINELAQDR